MNKHTVNSISHPLKSEFLEIAQERGEETEDIRTYVLEAEHQDGARYWDNFQTGEEVYSDYMLYMSFSKTEDFVD